MQFPTSLTFFALAGIVATCNAASLAEFCIAQPSYPLCRLLIAPGFVSAPDLERAFVRAYESLRISSTSYGQRPVAIKQQSETLRDILASETAQEQVPSVIHTALGVPQKRGLGHIFRLSQVPHRRSESPLNKEAYLYDFIRFGKR